MATSRLEPVAVVRADATRALVLWRRNGELEGALGTAAGFDAPFAIAGDPSRSHRAHPRHRRRRRAAGGARRR